MKPDRCDSPIRAEQLNRKCRGGQTEPVSLKCFLVCFLFDFFNLEGEKRTDQSHFIEVKKELIIEIMSLIIINKNNL